ncbi:hypothetical protein B0O44_106290 [Pedobacter nutrimenti]|jgi:hypothetical protein|uniref:Uncharacterized protein n=1 Tax=Pedobacter nutrimenti TaxID=1241337 RepID=A0A318UAN4_9SPHI|nr:hypothetical protein B0O44_106290 [Pedobacter nutrimenti]
MPELHVLKPISSQEPDQIKKLTTARYLQKHLFVVYIITKPDIPIIYTYNGKTRSPEKPGFLTQNQICPIVL